MNNSESISLVETGYKNAQLFAKNHYENFPVISWLIPSYLRNDVAVVYWFARTADDLADEGNLAKETRLQKLGAFEGRLLSLHKNNIDDSFEAALKHTIDVRELNPQNFSNLIKAFKQDVVKSRYQNYNEVLDYCSRSANPVGRILLELFNIRNEKANYYSDKICTALQITNFIQDTTLDYQKGRIYYPQDEMERFEVEEKMFEMSGNNLNLKRLIEFSVVRVQDLFDEGKNLLEFLSGRFKYEIDWTIKGGEEILRKIRGADFDVLSNRPYLTKFDFTKILINTIVRH